MSVRSRVLQALRTVHDSLTALGEHAATEAEHLVQLRTRMHDFANVLQKVDHRTEQMARSQVTRGDVEEMHKLLKELVAQGRAMQKHILEDHDEHGERLMVLEKRVGVR